MKLAHKNIDPVLVKKRQAFLKGSILTMLKLKVLSIAPEQVCATFVATKESLQFSGHLNGGVSLLVAESLASMAAQFAVGINKQVLGIEINASHLNSVTLNQKVTVTVAAIKVGRRLSVWHIEMRRPDNKITCTARCSVMHIDKIDTGGGK